MINKQNLCSKESVEVKRKDGKCNELRVKLWFESDWYICNITESKWFSKRLPKNKVPNNHFVKSVQKQPYVNVLQKGVFQKFRNRKILALESLFNKVAGLTVCSFMKKRSNTDVSL